MESPDFKSEKKTKVPWMLAEPGRGEEMRLEAASKTRLAVGDRDPTSPFFSPGSQCGARDGLWMCTRPPGHEVGQHAVGSASRVAHVWDA